MTIIVYRQTRKRWNLDTREPVDKSYVCSFEPMPDEQYKVEGEHPVCDLKPYRPYPFLASLSKIEMPGRWSFVPCEFGVDWFGGSVPIPIEIPDGAKIVRGRSTFVEWADSPLKSNLGPVTILHADDVWQLASERQGFRFASSIEAPEILPSPPPVEVEPATCSVERSVPFFVAEWRMTHDGRETTVEKGSLSPIEAESYVGNLGSLHTIQAAPVATHRLILLDGWESTGLGLRRDLGGQIERIPDISILPRIRAGHVGLRIETIAPEPPKAELPEIVVTTETVELSALDWVDLVQRARPRRRRDSLYQTTLFPMLLFNDEPRPVRREPLPNQSSFLD